MSDIATASTTNLKDYCRRVAEKSRTAAIQLATSSSEQRSACLRAAADAIRADKADILKANVQDVANAPHFGLTEAAADRLRLDSQRIDDIATGVGVVASLPDPVGELIETSTQPSGLQIRKIRVPLGVIFFVYESRPNVTADAAAVAIASGNAVILRGGKEAAHSSKRIVESIRQAITASGLPTVSYTHLTLPTSDLE